MVWETCGSDNRRWATPVAAARFGGIISTTFAPVRGSLLSSRKVATDATFGLRKWSGLKSNGKKMRSGEIRTTKRTVATTTAIRCRSRSWSTGASAANPIGRGSAGGFSTQSSAGRSVMLVRNAILMPEPAIWPSSARPRYAVGTKDENPKAVAAAASASGAPTLLAALSKAFLGSPDS